MSEFNTNNEFPEPQDFVTFAQAVKGNHKAIATIYNEETGDHRTYMFNRNPKDDTSPVFVKMLFGTDAEDKSGYAFIGTIFPNDFFRWSPRSTFSEDSPGVKGFEWVWNRVTGQVDRPLPSKVHLLHAGRCGRCGRRLTSPDSLYERQGIGPVCARKMGLA